MTENSKDSNLTLRTASGSINSLDAYASLFYTLMRDGHISPAALEDLVREEELYIENEKEFTNGWLAQYAINLSRRLSPDLFDREKVRKGLGLK